ncbi:MAG: glycosyltransferase family 2 protein [Actinomycetota bacterium]|nr:glycosyltransferase family 2 protein [Actinomycetota bacterium]
MNPVPILSIVLPAFNEAEALPATLERIRAVADVEPRLAGSVEIIVVSDGSTDSTFDTAAKELAGGACGLVVELARNVGSHAALRCGLRHARGEFVALMSADGQDPPELLPAMLAAFGDGLDIVWGRRTNRRADRLAARVTARAYYWMFRRLTGLDYPPAGFDFVVVRRPVVEALLLHRERNASLFLLLFNLGFGQTFVDYERGERTAGQTRWTVRRKLKLAVDMLTGFSAAPIRLVSLTGVLVGMLGLLFGGFTVVRALLGDVPVSGWASLMVVTSLMGGLMLIAVALLGEYVWRTLDEVRQRPLYLESRRATVNGKPAGRMEALSQ